MRVAKQDAYFRLIHALEAMHVRNLLTGQNLHLLPELSRVVHDLYPGRCKSVECLTSFGEPNLSERAIGEVVSLTQEMATSSSYGPPSPRRDTSIEQDPALDCSPKVDKTGSVDHIMSPRKVEEGQSERQQNVDQAI